MRHCLDPAPPIAWASIGSGSAHRSFSTDTAGQGVLPGACVQWSNESIIRETPSSQDAFLKFGRSVSAAIVNASTVGGDTLTGAHITLNPHQQLYHTDWAALCILVSSLPDNMAAGGVVDLYCLDAPGSTWVLTQRMEGQQQPTASKYVKPHKSAHRPCTAAHSQVGRGGMATGHAVWKDESDHPWLTQSCAISSDAMNRQSIHCSLNCDGVRSRSSVPAASDDKSCSPHHWRSFQPAENN